MLNFIKGFFCICWDYQMVFIFQFVNMVYHIDWFAYIEESLYISWNKFNFIMVYDLSNVLLNSVCYNFVEDICICSSVILACSVLFLSCLCLVLVSGWRWPRRMSLGVFLPLQYFWKSFKRIGISSPVHVE